MIDQGGTAEEIGTLVAEDREIGLTIESRQPPHHRSIPAKPALDVLLLPPIEPPDRLFQGESVSHHPHAMELDVIISEEGPVDLRLTQADDLRVVIQAPREQRSARA